MRRPTLREVGYALLLSIPPGFGATAFALHLVGMAPIILLYGVGVAVGLFVLLLVMFTTGENGNLDTVGDPS